MLISSLSPAHRALVEEAQRIHSNQLTVLNLVSAQRSTKGVLNALVYFAGKQAEAAALRFNLTLHTLCLTQLEKYASLARRAVEARADLGA